MEREQFTFYGSFLKGIRRIKNKSARCDAYDAIINYALSGVLPDLDSIPDTAAIAFEMAKPNIDASRRKAEAGRRGGGSKGEANGKQTEAKPKQTEADHKQVKEQVQEQVKGEEQVKEQVQVKEQMLEGVPPLPPSAPVGGSKAFRPPTIDEVAEYCAERHNAVDPKRFVDFYASKGWMIGRNKMKDWKAAVRTWEQRNDQKQTRTQTGGGFLSVVAEMEDTYDAEGDGPDPVVPGNALPQFLPWVDR